VAWDVTTDASDLEISGLRDVHALADGSIVAIARGTNARLIRFTDQNKDRDYLDDGEVVVLFDASQAAEALSDDLWAVAGMVLE
jgi:hypothetical protein